MDIGKFIKAGRKATDQFLQVDHRMQMSSSPYLLKGQIDPLNLAKVPNQFFTKDSIQHTFPKIAECFDSVIRFVGNRYAPQ